jgi:hypothetical protein
MVKYILDTNVYIEAYKGYYHPDIVPVYWDILRKLGKNDVIKSPKQVRDEIRIQNKPTISTEPSKPEDRFLYNWSRAPENKCFICDDLNGIDEFYRNVFEAYLKVKTKNTEALRRINKGWNWPRKEPVSDQDMFVIATVLFFKKHFPNNKYLLVTKEGNDNPPKYYKPAKIPHICLELGIEWMDDFKFIKNVGITFDSTKFYSQNN